MKKQATTEEYDVKGLRLWVYRNAEGVVKKVQFDGKSWLDKLANEHKSPNVELSAEQCLTLMNSLRDLFPGGAP